MPQEKGVHKVLWQKEITEGWRLRRSGRKRSRDW